LTIAMDAVKEELRTEKGKWIHIIYPNPEPVECVEKEFSIDLLGLESGEEASSVLGEIMGSECFKCIQLTNSLIGLDHRLKPLSIFVIKPGGDSYRARYTDLFERLVREWVGYYTDTIQVESDPDDYDQAWSFQRELSDAIMSIKKQFPDNPIAVNLESFPGKLAPQAILAGLTGGALMGYYLYDNLPFIQPLPPIRLDWETIRQVQEGSAPVSLIEAYAEARIIVYDAEEDKYKLNPSITHSGQE
jgi:hypothetical protein